ncbi:cell wall hydrolase [Novosphingobium soli]|uniref:Cell wall hydrolase n=1 Tax=Novosphingobium soli TaxID=574956 RepID=A0ABV6CWG6_9SPHN
MRVNLTSLFSSGPGALAEFPWLTPSPRKRRKARMVLYSRAALVLSVLAAPQIAAIEFGDTPPAANAAHDSPTRLAAPRARVIDAPFAPKSLRALSAQEAEMWNAKIAGNPFASSPAVPFALSPQVPSFSKSLECLAAAVYYEAANEPIAGQRAVAQVVLNRVRHPEYPHSVCGVVFQGSERRTGCQFSFTCDGSLQRKPSVAGWQQAQGVAAAALAGSVYAPVGWSTHYHADYVVPYWAQGLQKLTTVGRHIFYRWNGAAGEGASFTSRVQVTEPEIALLPSPAPNTLIPSSPDEVKRVAATERPIIAADPSVSAVSGSATPEPPAIAPAAPLARPPANAERWIIGSTP